ncbi:MAG: DUF4249 domain-containing protein [Saprospiraceae bacterium]|nr:DUF4249 domain-containing protein [Saprospiraceae bacterium]
MKNSFQYVVLCFAAVGLSCNLENEVVVDLPAYEPQVVVECYLESNKPVRLLLARSNRYFDAFDLSSLETVLDESLEQEATVRVKFGSGEIDLRNEINFDAQTGFLGNYLSWERVPETADTFFLEIILSDGSEIRGQTVMIPEVPFDSIVIESEDTLARVLMYFTDTYDEENFYRRHLHRTTLDSVPYQDFLAEDTFSDNGVIVFGTGFEFEPGDTVINTLYHLTKAYYDYLVSVTFSIQANLDPITQPGSIFSNVSGSANPLGIFTALSYARDTTVIDQ